MYKIGIFGSKYQGKHIQSLSSIFKALRRDDVALYFEQESYDILSQLLDELSFEARFLSKDECLDLDLAISLGGDGNFLRTARYVSGMDIPILGINLGHLGFLTNLDVEEAAPLIHKIFTKEYSIEERSQLAVYVDDVFVGNALNDLALLKRETGSMIHIHTDLDNEYLANYEGDGLIIATPSGSTAYSLSVFGPIITPTCPCLLLAPIAPHSLSIRPLVISDEMSLQMRVEARNNSFLLVLDGESKTYPCGVKINAHTSEHRVKMLRLSNRSFAETLQRKLHWAKPLRD